MSSARMVTAVTAYLASVNARIKKLKTLTPNAGLVIGTTAGKGLDLMPGFPITMFPLAYDNASATQLKTLDTPFLDVRTATYWVKTGGAWASTPYLGEETWLRPQSFVYDSQASGKVYFYNQIFNFYPVDLAP